MKGTRAGKTFAANMSLPQPLKHLWQSRQLQRLKISREQTSEPAKPSLRELAGVKPADKSTEQDGPKRDRPRLVFQPIHAVMEQNGQNKQTSESTEPSDPADDLLNINIAESDELQTLKGVGPVTAQRIIDYRNQIGRFDNVDQLLEVKGIGEKTLAKFRDQVCAR